MALPIPRGKKRNARGEYNAKRVSLLAQGVDPRILNTYMPKVGVLGSIDAEMYGLRMIEVCKRFPKAGD